MVSVHDRLKLKREFCDTWSTREQLCLASSVVKSGDQNWISVSRSLKPFAEKEALRPPDWFSQKSCAVQYAVLLEKADTPKRKKREGGETSGEAIVRRLTQERVSELGQILAFQRDEYQQLKTEVNLIRSGSISDEKLQKMWQAIEQEEREGEQKARAHSAWLAKRRLKQELPSRDSNNLSTPKKSLEVPSEITEASDPVQDVEEEKKNRGGRSPLLTSLLKSPTPTTQNQYAPSTAQTTSPTIASLLGAAPKPQTSQIPQNLTSQLQQIVSTSISSPVSSISSIASISSTGKEERPSAGAPTLSMMLQLPANIPRGSLPAQQNQNSSSIITNNTSSSLKTQKLNVTTPVLPASTASVNPPINKSIVQSIDSIEVIGKDKLPDVTDKDEINEILGDIEEFISKDISPGTVVTPTETIKPVSTVSVEGKINQKPVRDIDESVSPLNSPNSEMGIEELDQCTTSIAEIIGTAVELEPKVIVQRMPEKKQTEEEKVIKEDEKKENVAEEVATKAIVDKVEEKMEVEKKEEKKEIKELVKEKDDSKTDENQTINNLVVKDDEKVEDKEIEQKSTYLKEDDVTPKNIPIDEKIDEKVDEKIKEIEEDKPEMKQDDEIEKFDDKVENSKKSESELIPEKVIESDLNGEKPESEEKEVEKIPEDNKTNNTEEKKIVKEDKINLTDSIKDKVNEVKDEEVPSKDVEVVATLSNEAKQSSSEPENTNGKLEDIKEETIEQEKILPSETSDEKSEITLPKNEIKEESSNDKKEVIESLKNQPKEKEDELESKIEEKVEEKMDEVAEVKEEILDEKIDNDKEKVVKEVKEEMKKEEEKIKKDETPTTIADDTEEEESSMTKLSGRAIKTYSKKQNVAIDSEPETESSEGADYRAWKKSIMLVFNRLATHKYASLFLKPITEEYAPGYHSVVFRPMDLSTIKKNIDNGTIRSTTQFQRDVMLMFQNAIMYNKHDTAVYKMAVSMQEECLEQLQVLVEVTVEGPFRRETRTAASSSSETSESNIMKRKRSHITPSPLDTDSPRLKKRRKSEND